MMQALNTVFVLLLIPTFQKGVYPLLSHLRIPPTPLQVLNFCFDLTSSIQEKVGETVVVIMNLLVNFF